MRALLYAALILAVVLGDATAQERTRPVEVREGARVRVLYPTDVLSPGEGTFTGVLVSLGDTLVLKTDEGNTIRVVPRDIVGFDVSTGRRPFPYWVPAAGGALGLAAGHVLARGVDRSRRTCAGCGGGLADATARVVLGTGVVAGVLAGVLVGRRMASDRWVSVSGLGSGVRMSVRF